MASPLCKSDTERSGGELSSTFWVIKLNRLGQMSHERSLIKKSSGHADLRRLAHFTRGTRAEHVVSRNYNWQFWCWVDSVTFTMQCSLPAGRIIRKKKDNDCVHAAIFVTRRLFVRAYGTTRLAPTRHEPEGHKHPPSSHFCAQKL